MRLVFFVAGFRDSSFVSTSLAAKPAYDNRRHVRMANPGPPRLPPNVQVPQPAPQPEFTKYLNVEIAKIVAFLMVMSFVMYHGVIHMKYGKS